MKVSTRNRAAGAANIVKGETKAAAGKASRNRLLQAKGKVQSAVGKIQRDVGKQQRAQGD